MSFQEAIQNVKKLLHSLGTNIDINDYDGIIVKKLAASNTLDEGRKTNQTHIAITGEQMDIFPYLCADGYFYDDTGVVNEDLKKFFIIRIQTTIFRSNCNYLGINVEDIHFESEQKKTGACVVRSKRAKQTDQLQLSMLNSDGIEFVSFRKGLHEGDTLIVLKAKGAMNYHMFGIKAKDATEHLEELNNRFIRSQSVTIVDAERFNLNTSAKDNANALCGKNELYYGVPGAGKSHTIDQLIDGKPYERVVFHPDYTYSDFVGQIMPKLKKDNDGNDRLTYEFIEGPFTKIMKEATKAENKGKMFYLVIEEINRGNAPAIFGDIFQLLDRNENGEGKYHITNFDIAREVYGDETAEVKIPANLSILATMNTSDQNVFTLDTAFQRRWNMKHIKNDIGAAKHADVNIEGSSVTWGQFASAVNAELLNANEEIMGSEDKQLGAYFVEADELSADKFPEKALKYLWDDAFKMERDRIFDSEIKSIGGLVTAYADEIASSRDPIKRVMKEEVFKRMMDLSAKSVEDAYKDDEIFEAQKDD